MFFKFLSLLWGSPGRVGGFAPGWSQHRWLRKPSLSEEPPLTAVLSLGQYDCTHQQHSCPGPICLPAPALRPPTPEDQQILLAYWSSCDPASESRAAGWTRTVWAPRAQAPKLGPTASQPLPLLTPIGTGIWFKLALSFKALEVKTQWIGVQQSWAIGLVMLVRLKQGTCPGFRRRKWQPTPVFLPRESRGQRSLVGCCA